MTHYLAQHLQQSSGPPDLDGMTDRLWAAFPIALAIGVALLLILWLISLYTKTKERREFSDEVQRLKASGLGHLSDEEVQRRALDNLWQAKKIKRRTHDAH